MPVLPLNAPPSKKKAAVFLELAPNAGPRREIPAANRLEAGIASAQRARTDKDGKLLAFYLRPDGTEGVTSYSSLLPIS
jgi:hypothetical protein